MRVYVATAYGNREAARAAIRELRLAGHTVVGDWTYHTTEGETESDADMLLRAFAQEDRHAVEDADALLLLHDERGKGSFAELGIAVGAGVRCIVVVGGEDMAPYKGPIFYLLPEVVHVDSVLAAINYLDEEEFGA